MALCLNQRFTWSIEGQCQYNGFLNYAKVG